MNLQEALDVAADLRDSVYARPRDKIENALIDIANAYNALRALMLKQAERAANPAVQEVTFNADGTVTAIDGLTIFNLLTAQRVEYLGEWDAENGTVCIDDHDVDLCALAKAINEHFKVK